MQFLWYNKCKEKQKNASKSLHLEWMRMYRYSNGQIRLSDFKQPMGMNLKEDNRWVKRALLIPWNDIEKRYASLFTNRKGNVAKPLHLTLGACIIQADYGYSDEETTCHCLTMSVLLLNLRKLQRPLHAFFRWCFV